MSRYFVALARWPNGETEEIEVRDAPNAVAAREAVERELLDPEMWKPGGKLVCLNTVDGGVSCRR